MINLCEILDLLLNENRIDYSSITDAIDNKYRVVINYNSHGENIATGWRIIEVYAYGLTKSGNPVIRAYQPYGDTSSKIPSWKFFRVDRIMDWKKTGQYFNNARPLYNQNGDETMSVVYHNASFGDSQPKSSEDFKSNDNIKNNAYGPKLKDDSIYKTNSEIEYKNKMNNLKNQLANPIYLKDLKNGKTNQATTGPKKKQQIDFTNSNQDNIFNKSDKYDDKTSEFLNKDKDELTNGQK